MKLYLVRHGDPNYRDDCITELGKLQAAAAAERLRHSGIEKIFSSSCGRAVQTARATADVLGIGEIEILDFMREISWGARSGEEIFDHGRPWSISERLAEENNDLLDPQWRSGQYFENNKIMDHYDSMVPQIDGFTAGLGLVRQGLYYRVENCPYKTVALFSHGGSSSVLISRLFNLPLPFVTSALCPECTAITVVSFAEGVDGTVAPKFEIANDSRHIEGLSL
ncbi:MAG: histidine phosphatase family protein [Clostridia bacterium]|nr:histidine phosphatase family protein [Clostridia bacterium]